MCNSYRIQPKRGEKAGIGDRITDAIGKLPSPLVRKSDPGVVVRADGRVEIMRWGFHRSFNASINNTRSDKLETGMWKDAFRDCRCVIPMSLFYEWGPGIGGRKQAHEFLNPQDDFLWVAGIWEENPDMGNCYSMVTTGSSPVMAAIHDRMPAILNPGETGEYLAGSTHWNFQPFAGPLAITRCESPLAKPKPVDPQQELF